MSDTTRELAHAVWRVAASYDALAIDRNGAIPRSLLAELGDLGAFGVTVPERFGGIGLGLPEACAVVAAVARHDRSVAVTLGLHLGLGTHALVEHGSESLAAHWLPAIARGEAITAFCATEPSSGSDLTRLHTRATPTPTGFVLDGEKAYVTNGALAACFTVLASTTGAGGARGASVLLVPASSPGISIGREERKLGLRGSSTVSVRFDGVEVPADHVLGREGAGRDVAHRALAWGRTIMSAGCVGTARAAFELTLLHVRARQQFGASLLALGGVRSQIARMRAMLFAMEACVDDAARAEPRDLAICSTIAKVFASEAAFEITDRAIQLHGAAGYMEDMGIALLARDCRVTRIFEGSNDVLLLSLGTALAASGAPPAQRHATDETRTASEVCRRAHGRLERAIESVRSRFGVYVIRHPLVLTRLARAAVDLRAATLSLSRAEREPGCAAIASHAALGLVERAKSSLAELMTTDLDEALDDAVIASLGDEPVLQTSIAPEVRS